MPKQPRRTYTTELSNTLEKGFVLRCLKRVFSRCNAEIMNSDQGSHFTNGDYCFIKRYSCYVYQIILSEMPPFTHPCQGSFTRLYSISPVLETFTHPLGCIVKLFGITKSDNWVTKLSQSILII